MMSQRHIEASHLCGEEKEAAVNMIQIPVSFEDVAVYFTEEEWVLLDLGQKALYQEIMMENYKMFVSLAGGNGSQPLEFRETIWLERMEKTNLSRASLERTKRKCFQSHKGEKVRGFPPETGSLQDREPYLPLLCEKDVKNVPRWTVFGELMRHKRRERDPECAGRIFPLPVDLVENQARQMEGAKRYLCSNCEKGFDESSDLVAHERDHITEKIYQCLDCAKRFSHLMDLLSHKKNHQGEKPHRCPLDCHRCTRHKEADLRDPRIPPPEPPCECPACGVIFSWKANLVRHWRIHTGEKPHRCAECGKSYTEKKYLRKHMKSHAQEGQASVGILLV